MLIRCREQYTILRDYDSDIFMLQDDSVEETPLSILRAVRILEMNSLPTYQLVRSPNLFC